ncbi:hypothetical protein QWZ08_07195 [Ferruginibacter paludis]|uniref:hypothetical protein n=1 Tax=Ferruginibacter paludis TaxID=1310417 RepID=UPI0025B2F66D|nr:hypothetical protein [Ferruginibacter paludis]MDN3655403.1 hypothetical protein [Ferruginibacter paludis]
MPGRRRFTLLSQQGTRIANAHCQRYTLAPDARAVSLKSACARPGMEDAPATEGW